MAPAEGEHHDEMASFASPRWPNDPEHQDSQIKSEEQTTLPDSP
jgi:hypothetical protein